MWDEPFDIEALEHAAADEERVLVAVVPSVRDWERVQAEGWYRIPVRRAPARIGAQYLAFYHTGAFDEPLRWHIAHYAPIRGYHVVRRDALLPEEADHPRAGDLYYKVEVGPLIALPEPIPSRRLRRITFISTTLALLLGAREVNDLWDRETARDRLWKELRAREVPAQRNYLLRDGEAVYRIDLIVRRDPLRLAILCEGGGRVGADAPGPPPVEILARRGWEVLTWPTCQVMSDTRLCADAVCRWLDGRPPECPPGG
jgi:hypothetical protein